MPFGGDQPRVGRIEFADFAMQPNPGHRSDFQTAKFPPRDDAKGEPVEPTNHDLAVLTASFELLLELRKRLSHLSWFMRCLCEKSNWVEKVRGFGRLFKQAAGRSSLLVDAAARCSRCWFHGKEAARVAFCTPPAPDAETSTDISMTHSLEELRRPPGAPNRGPGSR